MISKDSGARVKTMEDLLGPSVPDSLEDRQGAVRYIYGHSHGEADALLLKEALGLEDM